MWLSLPLPPLEPGNLCGLLPPKVGGAMRRRLDAEAAYAAGAPAAAADAPEAAPPEPAPPTLAPALGGGPANGNYTGRPQVDLSDCLREFFEEESLGSDNLWRCGECKEFRCARAAERRASAAERRARRRPAPPRPAAAWPTNRRPPDTPATSSSSPSPSLPLLNPSPARRPSASRFTSSLRFSSSI